MSETNINISNSIFSKVIVIILSIIKKTIINERLTHKIYNIYKEILMQ